MQNPTASVATDPVRELHRRLPELMLRDERRLRRRLDGARKLRDPQRRRGGAAPRSPPRSAAAEQRLAARRGGGAGDHLPGGAAGQPAQGRHRRGDPRPPGRDRRRRDRLGQDHPAARRSAWSSAAGVRGLIGHTQPRRIAARTVAERIAEELGTDARRRGRLQGPVHRPGRRRHAGQADDRRHPARRDPARPDAAPVRHADHRRGARAQPQHRLHPRLPQAAAAAPARPQGDHHLGDHRPGAVRPALRGDGRRRSSRSPAGPTRSRSATGRWSTQDDEDDATRTPRPDRGDRRRGRRAGRRGPGRHPGVPHRRAGDPRHRRRAGASCEPARHRDPAAVRPAVRRRAAPGLRAAHRAAGSCSPPTSPRPR